MRAGAHYHPAAGAICACGGGRPRAGEKTRSTLAAVCLYIGYRQRAAVVRDTSSCELLSGPRCLGTGSERRRAAERLRLATPPSRAAARAYPLSLSLAGNLRCARGTGLDPRDACVGFAGRGFFGDGAGSARVGMMEKGGLTVDEEHWETRAA